MEEPDTDSPAVDSETDAPAEDSSDIVGRRSRVPWLVAAVAVVVAVGSLVFTFLQQGDHDDLSSAVDSRSEAQDVASRFGERLLTYEFDRLDEQADGIDALSTVEFADEFREAIGGGLGASIEELEASSTASVTEVLSSDVVRGRARVIVIVDSEITSDAGTRANIDTYLDITLLRLDGAWLVDDVQTVSSASDAPASQAPSEDVPGEDAPTDDAPADDAPDQTEVTEPGS